MIPNGQWLQTISSNISSSNTIIMNNNTLNSCIKLQLWGKQAARLPISKVSTNGRLHFIAEEIEYFNNSFTIKSGSIFCFLKLLPNGAFCEIFHQVSAQKRNKTSKIQIDEKKNNRNYQMKTNASWKWMYNVFGQIIWFGWKLTVPKTNHANTIS